MQNKRAEMIEKKANEARERLDNSDECIIDMNELMEAHNIYYREKELSNSISGASMLTEDGEKIVVIDPEQPENRKRFTTAHEIGHLLLEHSIVLNTQDKATTTTHANSNPSQILFLDDNTQENSDWREIEANYFATALLMPKEIVNREIKKLQKNTSKPYLSEFDVDRLAIDFKVSPIAMSMRLSKLGFM